MHKIKKMTLNPDLETLTAHAIQHWSKGIKHNGFLGPSTARGYLSVVCNHRQKKLPFSQKIQESIMIFHLVIIISDCRHQQESLANAQVSAQQQCVYEGP